MSPAFADKVDHQATGRILAQATWQALQENPSSTPLEEAETIWRILIRLRRRDASGDPLPEFDGDPRWMEALGPLNKPLGRDLSLMAAEHYAYGQYVALEHGDPFTSQVIHAYFSARDPECGEPQLPALPESDESRLWTLLGVHKGLQAYRESHEGKLGTAYSSRAILDTTGGSEPARAMAAAGV